MYICLIFPAKYDGAEEKLLEVKTCFSQNRVLPNVEFIEDLCQSIFHIFLASQLQYDGEIKRSISFVRE